MLRGQAPILALLFIPFSLSFFRGDCTALYGLFNVPCDRDPNVSYTAVDHRVYDIFYYYTSSEGIIYSYRCPQSAVVEYEGTVPLWDIEHWGDEDFIVVGSAGTVVIGNVSWSARETPTSEDLFAVCIQTATTAYAAGAAGTILKTGDYGETWEELASPTEVDLYGIDCTGGVVRIFGDQMVGYQSTDGGRTWMELDFYSGESPVTTPPEAGPPDILTSFFFDAATGYLFGEFGTTFFTVDSGYTWRTGIAPGFTRINTAYFVSVDSGGVAGDGGKISLTTDGGMSWFDDSLASSLTRENIRDFYLSEDTVATVVGDSGTLITLAKNSTVLSAHPEAISIPETFALHQNYPNPFNPATKIG